MIFELGYLAYGEGSIKSKFTLKKVAFRLVIYVAITLVFHGYFTEKCEVQLITMTEPDPETEVSVNPEFTYEVSDNGTANWQIKTSE